MQYKKHAKGTDIKKNLIKFNVFISLFVLVKCHNFLNICDIGYFVL